MKNKNSNDFISLNLHNLRDVYPLNKTPATNIGGLGDHFGLKRDLADLKNGYKLDWISFTVLSDYFTVETVLKLFNYDVDEFENTSGRFFYNSGLTLSRYVNVYYNNFENEKINGSTDTINFQFTGQGCTDLVNRNDVDMYELLYRLYQIDAKITRIDIAYDDFTGELNLKKVADKLEKGEYRSSKKSHNIVKSSNVNAEILSQTIYVGQRIKGGSYLRMYDKKAQYVEKNQLLPEIVEKSGIWQRYEIVLSKQKAHDFFLTLLFDKKYKNNIDRLYKEVFRDILEVLEPCKDQKKRRWKTTDWFEKFIQYDEKLNFVNHERDVDFGRLLEWLTVAVMPTIKVLDTILSEKGYDIYHLLENYNLLKSFSKKQERLINDCKKLNDDDLLLYLRRYLQVEKNGD